MKTQELDDTMKFFIGFILTLILVPLVFLVVNRPRKVETGGDWQQYARDHETDPVKRLMYRIEDSNKDVNPFKQ